MLLGSILAASPAVAETLTKMPDKVLMAQLIAKTPVTIERLGPNVAIIHTFANNVLTSFGPDGILIVDCDYLEGADRIVTAAKTLSDQPIRFAIPTHWHWDHSFGAGYFALGGATVVAQENVRKRMESGQTDHVAHMDVVIPPAPQAALPVLTYSQSLTFHLNGEIIDVIHPGPAHTDGDSIVHFRKANVIHMGDIFVDLPTFPFVESTSGGDFLGMIDAVEKAVSLANEKTVIVPGHGTPTTYAKLVGYRDLLVASRDEIGKRIKAGQTLAEIQQAKPLARFDKGYVVIRQDQFIDDVYKSLTAAAPSARN